MGDIYQKNWHLVTKARSGKVSILRNLSLMEAVKAREVLDPWRGMGYDSGWGGMRMASDGDIELREIIGPGEWDGCLSGMRHTVAINDGLRQCLSCQKFLGAVT